MNKIEDRHIVPEIASNWTHDPTVQPIANVTDEQISDMVKAIETNRVLIEEAGNKLEKFKADTEAYQTEIDNSQEDLLHRVESLEEEPKSTGNVWTDLVTRFTSRPFILTVGATATIIMSAVASEISWSSANEKMLIALGIYAGVDVTRKGIDKIRK